MRVQIKTWRNSASVRIPASVMAAASLRVGQAVDIRAERGCVIIEPIATPSLDLEGLLAGMTPDTFPKQIDFGPAVGGEVGL